MQTKMKSIGFTIALMLGVMALSACDKYVAETNEKIEVALERVEENLQRVAIPDIPQPIDTVRTKNDIWLGNSSVKIMEGDALPTWLETEDGITISIAAGSSLPTLVQELTDLTGIAVRIDDLKAEDAIPSETVPVNYSGKLSGLLNYISNRYGVWWRYKNGIISFFTKETRVFTVYALPTETKMDASITGASMGENSGGNSGSSSLSTSADLALWDSIEEGIKQVVGENGEVSFSRSTGSVTVTASPFIMRKVASYIGNWNEKLTRQVAISVKVLQVTTSKGDNYGFDLRAVFTSGDIAGSFSSPYYIDATGGTTAGALGLMSMTLINPNSKWKDTSAVIQAFSTLGKTALVTSSSVTTMNNKVAPVQVTTSENYVKESSVTSDGSGDDRSVEVDMETDTLNYGFSMEILPRILDHGRLIVLFSLTLSDLISLEQFSSSGGLQGKDDSGEVTTDSESTMVQLPKMQMRGFMQEIAMRSGSTLVLTGFEQVQDRANTSGIGKPKMTLLGGQSHNDNTRDVLVILLTPEVLESPLSPENRMHNF